MPLHRCAIIEGLARIHRCGIVHNDVVPKNVMIAKRSDGTYRISFIDFGDAEEHKCKFEGGVNFGGTAPQKVLCRELVTVARVTDTWKRGAFMLANELAHLVFSELDFRPILFQPKAGSSVVVERVR